MLGIDNVVFLAILTGKLPEDQQPQARTLGLALAAVGRIALLFAISWVITLDKTELFELPFAMPGGAHARRGRPRSDAASRSRTAVTPITAKDLVLILGGLFLLAKSTWEIGHQMEPKHARRRQGLRRRWPPCSRRSSRSTWCSRSTRC